MTKPFSELNISEIYEYFKEGDFANGGEIKEYVEWKLDLEPIFEKTEDEGDQFRTRYYIYEFDQGGYILFVESLSLQSGEFLLEGDVHWEVTDQYEDYVTRYVFGYPVKMA